MCRTCLRSQARRQPPTAIARPKARGRLAIAPFRPARTTTWLAAAVSLTFAIAYVAYSLGRHRAFATTGFDLGIFEQAVSSYAHGHWPTSNVREPGLNLLGDHFHPILAVLAPFYRLLPHTETLLVAQALLLAISVLPITRYSAVATEQLWPLRLPWCW
ncbi:DUF2079 domain-containing protein [Kribbella sp. NBC_01245]|uniref:DUF2079 domain-containing protein n=1 Tax=Kribbella sp. NBC_01245 TaxID=2903578 RepID=UPI002E2DD778|nr:DUF2079 domain-containing protein [Kribbella sp. NBC_01245]